MNATLRIIHYKDLERDALIVLTHWQGIDALTNDVLLKRVSLADGGAVTLIADWERRSLEFSLALARFNDRRKLAPLGLEVISDVEGAAGLWILVERKLSAAQTSIRSILRSGLASKVMVNGFLPTFYRLRLEGLLSEREIVEISDIVSTLEILDTATEQFDQRLRAVISNVSRKTDARILQVTVMTTVLTPLLAVLALFAFLSYRRFRQEELRRRQEADGLRRGLRHEFLYSLFFTYAESAIAESELRELGVGLPFQEQLALGLFRFDRSSLASEIPGKDTLIDLLESIEGSEREVFPVDEELVAVLLDAAEPAGLDRYLDSVRQAADTGGTSISAALSEPFSNSDDKPTIMEQMTALFTYRYAYGPKVVLRASAPPPQMAEEYQYPQRIDELLSKRLMEGRLDDAQLCIAELLNGASGYAPATLRAVVARISSAFFSGIEKLERSAGFTLPSASIAALAEIIQQDTLKDAEARFLALLDEIAIIMERKRIDRSEELANHVDKAIAASYSDPNLSLEVLAERFFLSAGYLGRLYRKTRGKSVADAINEVRLHAARSSLASSDATIEAIATEVGISNPSSFYRLFKAHWGITPKDFRENGRVIASQLTGKRPDTD
ncbi:MAG: helix-turn-helix transcriptional regulator [Spirochaetota bacterium]